MSLYSKDEVDMVLETSRKDGRSKTCSDVKNHAQHGIEQIWCSGEESGTDRYLIDTSTKSTNSGATYGALHQDISTRQKM
ncbi:hypothetical protein DPMN_116430 [Dreissena polymorpha]|uniref:Uncharacterized protein n=1 Tax=Dreissena polymorpha TaxID=45954 RepID=A0A9D4QUQ9_DREPO|nr:hypothetical protein DPMN_116430 [Dreissena polymorpha]